VITHPRLFDPPYTGDEACDAVDRILESPSLRILFPGSGFVSLFEQAVREANAIGNLVFSSRFAANPGCPA
jgi:hypothetical protein